MLDDCIKMNALKYLNIIILCLAGEVLFFENIWRNVKHEKYKDV